MGVLSSGPAVLFYSKLFFGGGLKAPKMWDLRKKVVHPYRSTRPSTVGVPVYVFFRGLLTYARVNA